jgi:hypothetical protein
LVEKGSRGGENVKEQDGGSSSVVDEFDRLKDAVLFHYLKDVRRMGANIFVNWWNDETAPTQI